MSNLKYRIKVETTNEGKKKYIAQVGSPFLLSGKILHLFVDWKYLVDNRDSVSSSDYSYTYYDTQEDAMKLIERYKIQQNKERDNEVKTVEYIKVK